MTVEGVAAPGVPDPPPPAVNWSRYVLDELRRLRCTDCAGQPVVSRHRLPTPLPDLLIEAGHHEFSVDHLPSRPQQLVRG